MSDRITFYHNPHSRSQMVHFMLEEVGADYDVVPIDFETGDNRTTDFLRINPMGKIPTIIHKGVTVTETAAIIAYLADAFPAAGLAPALDDPQRGRYLRWLMFGGTVFEPALMDKMLDRPQPERKGALGHGSWPDVIASLKAMLDPGPWILGGRFSAADVYLGAELGWAMQFGAPDLKGDPVFDAYVARIGERPAYARSSGQG